MKHFISLSLFALSLSASAAFTRLATETYPGGGSGGVTPGTVTNIANNRIDAKVSPWAMNGQPKPTADLTGITNLVVASSIASTNYTDSATNALDEVHRELLDDVSEALHSEIAATNAEIRAALIAIDTAIRADAAVSNAAIRAEIGSAAQDATNYTDAATLSATNFVKSVYLPKDKFLFVEDALTEYADIRIVGPGEVNVYGEAFVISNIDGNTYKITNKNGHNYIKYPGQTSAQAVSTATVNYGVEIELYDGGDWNDFTGFRNWMDYSNYAADDRSSTKADLVSGATANHFASLTANGNLADSGKKASDFAPSIEGGYYPFEHGNIVSNTVSQWEEYWNGSNVYWSVTNYVERGNAKIIRLYEIQTNGVTREIWNDSDKYDIFFTNTLDAVSLTNNYTIGVVSNMLDSKADRAWGKYTSAGYDVPDTNMVWHTAPTTVFAGGFEFQKVAVAGGEIGVLVSQGAVPYASGAEGKFIIGDGFGTNYFGYVKKDDYIIATHVDDIEKTGDMVTLKYDLVFSGEYPIVYYSPTVLPVTAQTWIQLNKADGTLTPGAPYPVTFSTGAGYIKAHISFAASPQPQGFFTSSTAVIGGGTFKTNMKADFLDAGLMCTNTDTKVMGVIRPTFDGTTVHWNWSKQ